MYLQYIFKSPLEYGGGKTSGTVKKLMMINDWDKLLFS